MTLQEAKDKFLGKVCDIQWIPLGRPMRNGETIMMNTTNVLITEIYMNCYGEILFRSGDTTPHSVERLINPREANEFSKTW